MRCRSPADRPRATPGRYAVLVGAGIGSTPAASILKHIKYRLAQVAKTGERCRFCKFKLKKLYFVWSNRDAGAFRVRLHASACYSAIVSPTKAGTLAEAGDTCAMTSSLWLEIAHRRSPLVAGSCAGSTAPGRNAPWLQWFADYLAEIQSAEIVAQATARKEGREYEPLIDIRVFFTAVRQGKDDLSTMMLHLGLESAHQQTQTVG